MQKMKICSFCKKILPISSFGKNSASKDGLMAHCLECDKGSLQKRFSRYKANAKSRHLNFKLNIDEFDFVTSLPCNYCGGYSSVYNEKKYNGIDRINSTMGYEKTNVAPCCYMCNELKFDESFDNFIKRVGQIYSNLERKGFYAELHVPNE